MESFSEESTDHLITLMVTNQTEKEIRAKVKQIQKEEPFSIVRVAKKIQ